MSDDAPLIAIEHLTLKPSKDAPPLLEDFSLAVMAGQTAILLGEADSGKLALLKLLANVRERGERLMGTIRFGIGESYDLSREFTITPRTAFLTGPYAAALNPHATALPQLIRVVARKKHISPEDARAELTASLARLPGAPQLSILDALPGTIAPEALASGLFAAALAQSPQLLLADDPLTQLSPSHARAYAEVLLAEQKKLGFAMIYAAQNAESAKLLNSNVVVLKNGQIVEQGSVARLMAAPQQAYTQALFRVVAGRAKEVAAQVGRTAPRGEALLQMRNVQLLSQPKSSRDVLNFELRRGASLALVGEKGSGRHALARALIGLDPVAKGNVIFDQVDISILGEAMMARLRRRVAFITGDDNALDDRMTIHDTVAEPLRTNLHAPRDVLARNRDAALKRVGLAALDGNIGVAMLSTFDKRRLQVARAVVSSPSLAVIDEPLRGLDAFAQSVVIDLLRTLREQEGPALLLITSDFSLARAFCDDAMVFRDGAVIERGPISAMLRNPKEKHTKKLIDAVAAGPVGGLSQAPAPV
jgi:peptide/nickel transport system ATP-binding protein